MCFDSSLISWSYKDESDGIIVGQAFLINLCAFISRLEPRTPAIFPRGIGLSENLLNTLYTVHIFPPETSSP